MPVSRATPDGGGTDGAGTGGTERGAVHAARTSVSHDDRIDVAW
jgi:hypothetical protein